MEPDLKQDFISHRRLNSEKWQNKVDKRNKILEIINQTYTAWWKLNKPLAIVNQKKHMIDVETQLANNTISSKNLQSITLDDKTIIGVDIKQRSRENNYNSPEKHELNYK